MSNIPDLIERLNRYRISTDPDRSIHPSICDEAAQALRDLQAVAEAAGDLYPGCYPIGERAENADDRLQAALAKLEQAIKEGDDE